MKFEHIILSCEAQTLKDAMTLLTNMNLSSSGARDELYSGLQHLSNCMKILETERPVQEPMTQHD